MNPHKSLIFWIYRHHWTGYWWFGPFLDSWGPLGALEGPRGVLGGLENPKLSISTRDQFWLWDVMFWVKTTCHTMFLIFWAKFGPSGPKKRPFWANIGYAEKCIFPKSVISNLAYIAPKRMLGTIFWYEILISPGTPKFFFMTADFLFWPTNCPHWMKLARASSDRPAGIQNTSTRCAWVGHIHIMRLGPLTDLYGTPGAP